MDSFVPIDAQRWSKITEHANRLADELGMTREQFYSEALIEFIEKTENQRLTEEYGRMEENEEDIAVLNRFVALYDPRLADQ